MRDVIIFSGSNLIRFALREIIEPVIIHCPKRVNAVLKICTSLPEFEIEISKSVNPVVFFDIDNVSFLNQYYILRLIKKKIKQTRKINKENKTNKINEINLIVYSKDSDLPESYSYIKDGNLTHLCKTATVMEIKLTTYQCLHRVATCFDKVPNYFYIYKNKLLELTDRESQILPLLMFGMTTKDIADLLHISIKTISFHKKNILDKYQSTSLLELYNKLN